jgi:hypothetical protein
MSGIAGEGPTALLPGGIFRKIGIGVMVLQQDVDDLCCDVIVAVCR